MSKIVEKQKELFGKYWIAVLPILMGALGYTGVDQYGNYKERQSTPDVNITIEQAEPNQVKNYTPDIKAAIKAHESEYHF